ncbi:MAG: Protein ArsC [Phycisphaerae bacterium]|nr:Protein ArsC [Phycisphaerae bacterium]
MASRAERLRVLFLCTGNACRSQMAEGWARALRSDSIEPYSAGTDPHGLNRLAVRAMAEAGIDISRHASKSVHALTGVPFDFVVTVCDSASEACPTFPAPAKVLHVGFDDPPRFAKGATTDDEALPHYRRVRDEIRRFVETLPQAFFGDSTMTSPACRNDSCCPPAASDANAVREQVREGYAKIAQGGSCGPSGSGAGCCGAPAFSPDQLAQAIGYTSGDLDALPDGANMGLSCGNPTALASLRPGEVVLDLGAGGGFDCFVAGPNVGRTGRVIGVDMTPDMLSKARRNVASYRDRTGLENVEFRLGEIEALPVADASVDVVISNCVLNLSPDKPRVWREIARVLKPGGRVAVSDLALLRPLPESVKADVQALVGCVAGAVLVEQTRGMASAAGLTEVALTLKPRYIDAMMDWQDPLYRRIVERLPAGSKPSDYITSLDVSARKPSSR